MNRGAFNNLFLAHAQVWGLLITLVAMILFIETILLGQAKLDSTSKELGLMLLGAFSAKFGDMVAYLYSRQRPDAKTVFSEPTSGPAVPTNPLNQPTEMKQ